jgi:hypothetical protein
VKSFPIVQISNHEVSISLAAHEPELRLRGCQLGNLKPQYAGFSKKKKEFKIDTGHGTTISLEAPKYGSGTPQLINWLLLHLSIILISFL